MRSRRAAGSARAPAGVRAQTCAQHLLQRSAATSKAGCRPAAGCAAPAVPACPSAELVTGRARAGSSPLPAAALAPPTSFLALISAADTTSTFFVFEMLGGHVDAASPGSCTCWRARCPPWPRCWLRDGASSVLAPSLLLPLLLPPPLLPLLPLPPPRWLLPTEPGAWGCRRLPGESSEGAALPVTGNVWAMAASMTSECTETDCRARLWPSRLVLTACARCRPGGESRPPSLRCCSHRCCLVPCPWSSAAEAPVAELRRCCPAWGARCGCCGSAAPQPRGCSARRCMFTIFAKSCCTSAALRASHCSPLRALDACAGGCSRPPLPPPSPPPPFGPADPRAADRAGTVCLRLAAARLNAVGALLCCCCGSSSAGGGQPCRRAGGGKARAGRASCCPIEAIACGYGSLQ